jgi:hypothetical protein
VFKVDNIELKVRILPIDTCNVDDLLDELVRTRQVHLYEAEGRKYGIIRNFCRWQHPQKPTFMHPPPAELPKEYRLHDRYGSGTVAVQEASGSGNAPVRESLPREEKRREEKKKSREETKSLPDAGPSVVRDPLRDLPKLARVYPKVIAAIIEAHPKAKVPAAGSDAEAKDRLTLRRLVEIDGYTEEDIIETLRWVLRDDSERAEFWRSNVRCIRNLRRTNGDGLHKFGKIHEAREDAGDGMTEGQRERAAHKEFLKTSFEDRVAAIEGRGEQAPTPASEIVDGVLKGITHDKG